MNDERRNRIIAAVTVNGILLIAILAAVIIYQVIQITIVKRIRNDILSRIEQLREDTEKEEKSLNYWKSQEGLEDLYYEYYFSQR